MWKCNGLLCFRTITILLPRLLLSHRPYCASILSFPMLRLTRYEGSEAVLVLTKAGHNSLVSHRHVFSYVGQLACTNTGHPYLVVGDRGVPAW